MSEERKLKIKFAGRFIDLLGHQMYGGPVPAVAEFIANAWDADAQKVEITIPEDPTINESKIIVRDFGEGMSFEELNKFYLNIGYERRKERGEKTRTGRPVMGRKGIGKLAGFGIAEDIELCSIKDKNLILFNLNYTKLKEMQAINDFEFYPDVDKKSEDHSGVIVTLKNLKLSRKINIENFRTSIARRFALNSDTMKIFINNEPITKESLEFEFRVPITDGKWQEEDIKGFGSIKYWFGFLNETIKDKELRGVSVYARDRLAQSTPFFFNLTGGINGQVGLEYLTGQIKADGLDDEIDYIATTRQSVNWQFGNASILEEWGLNKIKELCSDWKKRKDKKNLDKFKHNYSEYFPRIENLPKQEKEDLIAALEKIAGLERIEENDFKIIANSMISGIERESVKKIIKKINNVSENSLPELFEVIREWDILSAVLTAEAISGKIDIVNKFEKLIKARTPEKAPKGQIDMQTFIKDYPWLLGQEYEQFKSEDIYHEKKLDKWIKEEIIETDKEFKDEKIENRRFDLLVFHNPWRIIILELMRPGIMADIDHVNRLIAYVTRVEDAIHSKGTQEEFSKVSVYGLLIADKFHQSGALKRVIQNNRNIIDAIEWAGLFERVKNRYRDFYKFLKEKAPEDPRLKGL